MADQAVKPLLLQCGLVSDLVECVLHLHKAESLAAAQVRFQHMTACCVSFSPSSPIYFYQLSSCPI